LRVFHRTGIARRFIPEFMAITRLSQFDMFHKYSVDEHILTTVAKLESIPEGAAVNHEMAAIFEAMADIETVKLALLLHDLGKRAVDRHAVEEDTRTPVILERLGLGRLTQIVRGLIRNHLRMSATAQKLNFAEPQTLRNFCSKVGDGKSLKRLYLLTYADIAAVGPDVWNKWKDDILLELYDAAQRYFLEGESLFVSGPERLEELAEEVAKMDADYLPREVRRFLSGAPERYIRTATAAAISKNMRLVDQLPERRLALHFERKSEDSGEFTLASAERIGFFAIVAGAFSAKDLHIIETRIHTFKGHRALDTIIVKGANLSLYSEPEMVAKFENELADLLEGKRDIDEWITRRVRYFQPDKSADAITQPPQVLILNHLSEENTVLEIIAPDRLGLLYDITRTMARLKLNIESAKITTEGRMAVNVFYVTDEFGGKLAGTALKSGIEARIKAAIAG